MSVYTYSIFDQPSSMAGDAWLHHDCAVIEAESDDEAIEQVRDILGIAVCGLGAPDYVPGDRVYALITGPDDIIVAEVSAEVEP